MVVKKRTKNLKGRETDTEFYVQLAIIGILALVIVFSFGKIYGSGGEIFSSGIKMVSASGIVPVGVPAVYGSEIEISYDDVSPENPRLADDTIAKLRTYEDRGLSEVQMKRYIEILYTLNGGISCEYCCGAQSIIFEDGKRACGCAHSYAMRGLTKYLLTEHPEMSDEEILSEVGKWKTLFFPGIMEAKAQVLENKGIDSSDYINLASNKYRGIEKGQGSGGMVGGC